MGRTKVQVDKIELLSVINRLEAKRQFSTRQELFQAVAANLPEKITPAVVQLRVNEFNIEPKTPKGRRGRAPGTKLSDEQKAAMQRGRSTKREVVNIDVLRKEFPQSQQSLLDRVEKGSLSATIKANCLSCCSFQIKEITECSCETCPMWSFRPYQKR